MAQGSLVADYEHPGDFLGPIGAEGQPRSCLPEAYLEAYEWPSGALGMAQEMPWGGLEMINGRPRGDLILT